MQRKLLKIKDIFVYNEVDLSEKLRSAEFSPSNCFRSLTHLQWKEFRFLISCPMNSAINLGLSAGIILGQGSYTE